MSRTTLSTHETAGQYAVTLWSDKQTFGVTYGKQEKRFICHQKAYHEYLNCIHHQMACEGFFTDDTEEYSNE